MAQQLQSMNTIISLSVFAQQTIKIVLPSIKQEFVQGTNSYANFNHKWKEKLLFRTIIFIVKNLDNKKPIRFKVLSIATHKTC